jgi:quercetin dioxygenase-like cupin family protein
MSTRFIPEGYPNKLAIIDPQKAVGEDGQYRAHTGAFEDMWKTAETARALGMEIRWYYDQGIGTAAPRIIITEIPAGHIQPFHHHEATLETTLVVSGEIIAVESDTLTEQQCRLMGYDEMLKLGRRLGPQQMVVAMPDVRHTILNKTERGAVLVTIQTATSPRDSFSSDWHRKEPVPT